MGLLSKGDSGTAKQGAPSGSIKKYNYSQFVEEGRPSSAAVHTAAGYGSRVASSAALEMQLESSKRRANLGQLGADPRRKRSILCAPGRIWMHVLSLGQVGAGRAARLKRAPRALRACMQRLNLCHMLCSVRRWLWRSGSSRWWRRA